MGVVKNFLAAGLVCFIAAICWVPHLSESLRLDETLTYWVISGSFGDAIDRAVNFQPQPGYYAFLSLWTQIAGASEVALRFPSLLAMFGACFALARLGTALTGNRETGLLAALVLASSPIVFRDFLDARSYALGLLLLIAAASRLHAWLTEGRRRDAWLLGALMALLPQLHLFLVLAYPAFALYTVLMWRQSPVTTRQAFAVASVLVLGVLLYLPVAIALVEHSGSYSFVPRPQAGSLFLVFAWAPPVAGLIAGLCASGFGTVRHRSEASAPAPDPQPTVRVPVAVAHLLAAWLLVPLILLFGVSHLTAHSVFVPRYLIAAFPALALMYARTLRALPSRTARIVAALTVVAAATTNARIPEDFREAAHAVREFTAGYDETPILFATGMIESQDEAWLRDPALADYLTAPAIYYPLGGRVVPLPRKFLRPAEASEVLQPILGQVDRFAVVEWRANGADVLARIIPSANDAGYRLVGNDFGAVRVAFFRLDRPAVSPRTGQSNGQ